MDETLDMKPEDRIEYWKLVMSDFKESTLTRSDYCKQNDIKLSTFDYWRRRFSDLEACSEEDGSIHFIYIKARVKVPKIKQTFRHMERSKSRINTRFFGRFLV